MWATTKAIATLGVIYIVGGACIMIGMGLGQKVVDYIDEKLG